MRVLAGLGVLAAFLACAIAAWAVYEWAWNEPAVEDDSAVRAQVLAGNFALLENVQSVESLERISDDLWYFELGEGCFVADVDRASFSFSSETVSGLFVVPCQLRDELIGA